MTTNCIELQHRQDLAQHQNTTTQFNARSQLLHNQSLAFSVHIAENLFLLSRIAQIFQEHRFCGSTDLNQVSPLESATLCASLRNELPNHTPLITMGVVELN